MALFELSTPAADFIGFTVTERVRVPFGMPALRAGSAKRFALCGA